MYNAKPKTQSCSNCSEASPSFNLYHCSFHNEKRKACETCPKWRPIIEIKEESIKIEAVCASCYLANCQCCPGCHKPIKSCRCSALKNNPFNLKRP